jgi:hypothetical protein
MILFLSLMISNKLKNVAGLSINYLFTTIKCAWLVEYCFVDYVYFSVYLRKDPGSSDGAVPKASMRTE